LCAPNKAKAAARRPSARSILLTSSAIRIESIPDRNPARDQAGSTQLQFARKEFAQPIICCSCLLPRLRVIMRLRHSASRRSRRRNPNRVRPCSRTAAFTAQSTASACSKSRSLPLAYATAVRLHRRPRWSCLPCQRLPVRPLHRAVVPLPLLNLCARSHPSIRSPLRIDWPAPSDGSAAATDEQHKESQWLIAEHFVEHSSPSIFGSQTARRSSRVFRINCG